MLVILLITPFSGIMRRYGSEELLNTVVQALYNLVLMMIAMCVLKLGANYSRVVVFSMYGIHLAISLLFWQLWKRVLRSGRAAVLGSVRKSIFVIDTREELPQLLRSFNSDFFGTYSVQGICVVDSEIGEKIPVRIDETDSRGKMVEHHVEFVNSVKLEDVAKFVPKNRIDELYVGVKPSVVSAKTYSTLLSNGKGIHLGIRPMVGFDTESQFITTVGTYKALGIGMHAFDTEQLVYLGVKHIMAIVF